MARIRDFAVTINSADTTPVVCEMPVHQSGDLLIVFAGKDGTAIFNTPSGWGNPAGAASTGAYGSCFTKRAASAAETLSISLATTDASVIVVISVEGAYGTTSTGVDAISGTVTIQATDSTSPYTPGTVTPTHDGCLIFSVIYSDATYSIHPRAGWPLIFTGDSGTNSLGVCYTQQKTQAQIIAPEWVPGTGAADDTRAFCIAIRDDGTSNKFDAYLDRGTTPAYLLSRLNGSATGDVNTPAYIAQASAVLTSVLVNGSTSKTCTAATWGTAATDSAYDPYGTVSVQSGASSTSAFGLSECTFSTWNLSQGKSLVFGIYKPTIPRDYVDLGTAQTGGVAINFTNGTTSNARAWVIGGQFDATTRQADYTPFVIQTNQSNNTAYAWNGTVTWNNITRVGFLTQGYYGAASLHWHGFHVLNVAVLAGGHTANPFKLDDITRVINKGCGNIPIVQQSGSAITSMIPMQFGGGDPCAVSVNLASISFPTSKITDSDYNNFHVDPDYVGIEFYGKTASDLFKFTNTVFNSATSYYWRFNASHSSNASIDFTGSSVIKANVLLRSNTPMTSVSFINCTAFTQNGAALTSCKFTDTKVLASNPGNISYCSFTDTSGTNAIEITTPGTYTFTGNSFSGYGSTGTTEAAIVNNSGGAVILNVSGGAAPTYYNQSGTTTVNATISVTIEAAVSLVGAEIRVYDLDNSPAGSLGTEIDGTESCPTSTFTFASSAGNVVWIQILHSGYNEFGAQYTIPASNSTYTATLVADNNT